MNDVRLPSEDLIAHVKANTELFRISKKMMEISPQFKERIEKLNHALNNESLYFKDELWMQYHKCPLCDQYVVNPPAEIKYARADNRKRRKLCWNSALRILSRKTGWSPCYKCTTTYAKVLYYSGDFNSPFYADCCGIPRRCITATRTGLLVEGGEL